MAEFRMPSLGADMEQGTILEWRVAPGAEVHRGDIVALVETDKSDLEVEVFESGVIEQLLVAVGETVPVGTVLATIAAAGAPVAAPVVTAPVVTAPVEAAPVVTAPVVTAPVEAAPVAPGPVLVPAKPPVVTVPPAVVPLAPVVPVAPLAPAASVAGIEPPTLRSPVVRHLAEKLGVDTFHVAGTGPGGRVTRHDVEVAATAPVRRRITPRARRLATARGLDLASLDGTGLEVVTGAHVEAMAAPPATVATVAAPTAPVARADRSASMRRAIGRAMARSKREIPHYYLSQPIELSEPLAWLDELNAERSVGERILPAALLLKATAVAAREIDCMNGFYVDDGFRPGDGVHLAVAISLRGGGLIAPAIHDADAKSLPEVMAALKDLVLRARAGRLSAAEVSEGTLTVTNLGDRGVAQVFPVITPPQVATVGLGTIADQPWAVGGLLGVRPVVWASLAGDHRVSDGHDGARFLDALAAAAHDRVALGLVAADPGPQSSHGGRR